MPIEIKELTIRMNVREKTPTMHPLMPNTTITEHTDWRELKKQILEECIEEVMEILERRLER
ncbi:MAG: DUF5908 family protein [Thermonemataceae bacterium]